MTDYSRRREEKIYIYIQCMKQCAPVKIERAGARARERETRGPTHTHLGRRRRRLPSLADGRSGTPRATAAVYVAGRTARGRRGDHQWPRANGTAPPSAQATSSPVSLE